MLITRKEDIATHCMFFINYLLPIVKFFAQECWEVKQVLKNNININFKFYMSPIVVSVYLVVVNEIAKSFMKPAIVPLSQIYTARHLELPNLEH